MNNTRFTRYDYWLMDELEVVSYYDDLGNELYANDVVYDVEGTWVSEEEVQDFIEGQSSELETGVHVTFNDLLIDAEEYVVLVYEDIIYHEDDTMEMISHFFPKYEAEEVLRGE